MWNADHLPKPVRCACLRNRAEVEESRIWPKLESSTGRVVRWSDLADQVGFAEFVAELVEGFGDAIGVEGEGIAGAERALADFVIHFLKMSRAVAVAFRGACFSLKAWVREDGIGIGLTPRTFVRTTICTSDGVRV